MTAQREVFPPRGDHVLRGGNTRRIRHRHFPSQDRMVSSSPAVGRGFLRAERAKADGVRRSVLCERVGCELTSQSPGLGGERALGVSRWGCGRVRVLTVQHGARLSPSHGQLGVYGPGPSAESAERQARVDMGMGDSPRTEAAAALPKLGSVGQGQGGWPRPAELRAACPRPGKERVLSKDHGAGRAFRPGPGPQTTSRSDCGPTWGAVHF